MFPFPQSSLSLRNNQRRHSSSIWSRSKCGGYSRRWRRQNIDSILDSHFVPVSTHLNLLSRAYYDSSFVRWGKEASVASLVGRLHKLGLSVWWNLTNRTQLFRLKILNPLEINVTNPFVPLVDVQFDLLTLGKHRCANAIHLADEHPPFQAPLYDDVAFFFFDKAPEMSEPDLHSLVDDLSN